MRDGLPNDYPDWQRWRDRFAARRGRPLPDPFVDEPVLAEVPATVARSLAVFQLGESGGGTVVREARESRIPAAGAAYAEALGLFVAEEHRHAELLACAVRMLGGELIRRHWTARCFVAGRRLLGLRLKVTFLLAAEVVGICYYRLLASRLPAGPLRSLLGELAADELSHLEFHADFLRTQTRTPWRRAVFRTAWRTLMTVAAIVVLIDHRGALRDLDIPAGRVWRRWMRCGRVAEALVCGDMPGARAALPAVRPAGDAGGMRSSPPVPCPETGEAG